MSSGPSPAATLRETVATAARRLAESGVFVGTAGNISARSDDVVAITASGAQLRAITADQVTLVTLSGEVVDGPRPSSEIDLHLGVYRRPEFAAMTSVVHTHSRFATALSVVRDHLPVIHYQQLSLGGALRVAPFATFGTPELADAVHRALSGRLAALMANHGAVALGMGVDNAADNALLLEWLCEIYWHASSLGTPRELTEQQQRAVVEHALQIGYGTVRQA
ncbi:class II aldolase/adducin family protein [Gordonia sp. NB41Y]|uniref:class II aldolase/adducin family protein n=1 Tax=Gordonia sp. NB41Y TaxID=875808 RepID=UPI001651825A|nr:class II aldolase/adducin family protein [Gordonia sp. NB41Y]WLP92389.1 class II aldolase/adducin family protein [Gordonia sp. NB41Y]